MPLFNRSQRITIVAALVLFVLIGLFPPWRYSDGTFAGVHPVFSPPAALPDTAAVGDPVEEHMEIRMVPSSLYNPERKEQLSEAERRRPYLDIRRMLAAGGIVFILATVALFSLDARRRRRSPRES